MFCVEILPWKTGLKAGHACWHTKQSGYDQQNWAHVQSCDNEISEHHMLQIAWGSEAGFTPMMIQCIIHLQFTRHEIHLLTRCRSHFLMNMWSIKTLGHIETYNLVFHLTHQKWPKWLRFSGSPNPTSIMLEKARYNYPCRYRKMTIAKLDTLVKTNKISNP